MVMIAKTTGELGDILATYPRHTKVYLDIPDGDLPADWYSPAIGSSIEPEINKQREVVLLLWPHTDFDGKKVDISGPID